VGTESSSDRYYIGPIRRTSPFFPSRNDTDDKTFAHRDKESQRSCVIIEVASVIDPFILPPMIMKEDQRLFFSARDDKKMCSRGQIKSAVLV
jgi:hypothetical protein